MDPPAPPVCAPEASPAKTSSLAATFRQRRATAAVCLRPVKPRSLFEATPDAPGAAEAEARVSALAAAANAALHGARHRSFHGIDTSAMDMDFDG